MSATVRIEKCPSRSAADTRAQILQGLGFTTTTYDKSATVIVATVTSDGTSASNESFQDVNGTCVLVGVKQD